jgi:hypothetical protein
VYFYWWKGWNNVISAPLAKNEFFSVNELRKNFKNIDINSYKLRTNYKHEKNHTFLDGGQGNGRHVQQKIKKKKAAIHYLKRCFFVVIFSRALRSISLRENTSVKKNR